MENRALTINLPEADEAKVANLAMRLGTMLSKFKPMVSPKVSGAVGGLLKSPAAKVVGQSVVPAAIGSVVSSGANAVSNVAGDGDLSMPQRLGIGVGAGLLARTKIGAPFMRQLVLPSLISSYALRRQKEHFGGSLTNPQVVADLAKRHTVDAAASMLDSVRNNPKFKAVLGLGET